MKKERLSELKKKAILERRYQEKAVRDLSNIERLNLNLHKEQSLQMEVKEDNFVRAIQEIERGGNENLSNDIPLEERGGEVLENVNEVFNLIAMKIDIETKAR